MNQKKIIYNNFEFEFVILSESFRYFQFILFTQKEKVWDKLSEFIKFDNITNIDFICGEKCIGEFKANNICIVFYYINSKDDICMLKNQMEKAEKFYEDEEVKFIIITKQTMNMDLFKDINKSIILKSIEDFYNFICKIIPNCLSTDFKTMEILGNISHLIK